jgi:hypothetical protein
VVLLSVAVTACFVRAGLRVTSLAAFAAFWVAGGLVLELSTLIILAFEHASFAGELGIVVAFILLLVLALVWHVGAAAAIFRSMEPQLSQRGSLRRALALTITTLIAVVVVPYDPVFKGSDFNRSSANVWEWVRSALGTGGDDQFRRDRR